MIIDEVTEHGDIFEIVQVLRDTVMDVPHRLSVLEGILQLVVHGIVQSGSQRALVP